MPYRHEWLSRIKDVEREYVAMRQAAHFFQRAVLDDPNLLQAQLQHRDIATASSNLEGTYVVRLFAEFETGAREYWATAWNTEPRMADLLNGLAARRGIPDIQTENAHCVREYRNAMVHEREDDVADLSIALARQHLCRFFAFLPMQW